MDARTIIRNTAPGMELEALPVHPVTGLRAIAVLRRGPVWPVLGGAPDDEGAEGDDDEEEGEDDDEDEHDEKDDDEDGGKSEGKKPAKKPDDSDDDKVSRSELRKAIVERDRAKRTLREVRKEIDELRKANEGEADKATREARETAIAEVEKKYKPLIIQTSARAELIEAGLRADKVARFTRLLNLDEIDVENDGTVTGLSTQVDELKEEWPELFGEPEEERKPRRTAGSRGADGADKGKAGGGSKKELSVTERQAASLLGKRT